MDNVSIYLYKEFWVIPSFVQVEDGGPNIESTPVRIIPHEDIVRLKTAINEVLNEKPKEVSRKKLFEKKLEAIPAALNLKSDRDFRKDARLFQLEKLDNGFLLIEAKKEKGGWVFDPLWKKKFKEGEVDKIDEFLIKRTKKDLPKKNSK